MSGKNALPYYKRYPRDFIEGTIGLDLEIKGAYSILIDLIYMQGGQLPDDDRYISGLLGCSAAKWKRIREGLLSLGKIAVNGGKISNSRADFELKNLREFSATQAQNAAGSRKNNKLAKATAKPSSSQPEPEPEPIKKEPSVPKKGTRIPDDFEPDLDAAVAAGLRPERALMEAAKFKDYWKATPGAKGVKLDWPATWRNWFRSAIDRQGGPRGSPAQGKSAFREHQDEVTRNLERMAYGRATDDSGQPAFDLEPGAFRSDRKASAGKP